MEIRISIIRKNKSKTDKTEKGTTYGSQCDEQASGEEFDDLGERYKEGEIGKLASSVADLYGMLLEAGERQLREKEFMRDLISDISHQLKTPIATLTVFNDIFSSDDGSMSEEQRRDMLVQSERQLERMKWLIQALLQLARIEAESISFKKENVNARLLFEGCANMLKIKADEKHIRFVYELEENTSFEGDFEWMQEALVNIIKKCHRICA